MDNPSETPLEKEHAALLGLLDSVADELYALVCEIVRLGESLSSDELEGDKGVRIRDLQTFDLLAQSALAQARLLKGIERGLAERGESVSKNITLMIEDVPFHNIRQRLYSAYTGNTKPEATDEVWDESGDLDWF
jgi:hypothetical protein